MALTPEDLVRLVQDTISTSECDNPLTFEPPDWAIRAMQPGLPSDQGPIDSDQPRGDP